MKNTTLYFFPTIILAVLAICLSVYVGQSNRFSWELSLIIQVQSYENNILLSIMKGVSFLSTGWRSAVIVICSGLLFAWRVGLIEAFLVVLAGSIVPINILIKLAVSQSRPDSPLIRIVNPQNDFGYPSGHTFFAIMVLGIIAFLLFFILHKTYLRVLTLTISALLIIIIGISRIYLGEHWPSDVIGAYFIGGFFLSCLILFYFKMKALVRFVSGNN